MGGSLAAACRKKYPKSRITAVSRNQEALRFAKKKKWVDDYFQSLRDALPGTDLVILCTPVNTFPQYLKTIETFAAQPIFVTDVGSVKGALQRFVAKQKFSRVRFVGAHPMVGSHEFGIHAAQENLYDHGYTFVVKSGGGDSEAFDRILNFWKKISPKVIEVDSMKHDEIVSEISHVPHAVAGLLLLAAHPENLKYAASGFRDTTRVAAGHPDIWVPIFIENRKMLTTALKRFEKKLQILRRALQDNHSDKILGILAKSRDLRGQISL